VTAQAVRTCVACREREDRGELLRLVLDPEGALVVDLRGRLPGRGAWVHLATDCLRAVERDPASLARALKGPVTAGGLVDAVRAQLGVALLDGLSLASAGGALVGGADQLLAAIGEGRIEELVLASDAADRTLRRVREAGPDVPATVVDLSREALGARIGTAPRAAVGITGAPAAVHLLRTLRRLRATS
jgi:predicted RNA-binding protein YlxR (DUF448 family)